MTENCKKIQILLLAETNFILDVLFQQSAPSLYLYQMADRNEITLTLPEFAFAQAEGGITEHLKRRVQVADTMLTTLRQADRSRYHDFTELRRHLDRFREMSEIELERILVELEAFKQVATVVPHIPEHIASAQLRGLRKIAPFKESDQVIYETVLWFCRTNRTSSLKILFLTRDRNDFDYPNVHAELQELDAEICFSAGDCIQRIRQLAND